MLLILVPSTNRFHYKFIVCVAPFDTSDFFPIKFLTARLSNSNNSPSRAWCECLWWLYGYCMHITAKCVRGEQSLSTIRLRRFVPLSLKYSGDARRKTRPQNSGHRLEGDFLLRVRIKSFLHWWWFLFKCNARSECFLWCVISPREKFRAPRTPPRCLSGGGIVPSVTAPTMIRCHGGMKMP